MILVTSYGDESLAEWRGCFARLLTGAPVAAIDDPGVDVDAVEYVFVYKPPAGRLAQFPNLKLILSMGAGVDHIIKDPTWPRHIPLVRMGGEHTAQRMGEYVCLAALSLLRDMHRVIRAQAECVWDHFETPRNATQTRVGVMGLGNLGLPAARMLQRLGFVVSGWSRTRKSLEGLRCFAGPSERNAFLAQSDILVCLLPDTVETKGVLNSEALSRLPRAAGLVNAARGSHLVMRDLIDALDSGQLSGAVLDVFEVEPLPSDDPAWRHPGIVVTPHIGSLASKFERASYAAEIIARFERKQPLQNLYESARGY